MRVPVVGAPMLCVLVVRAAVRVYVPVVRAVMLCNCYTSYHVVCSPPRSCHVGTTTTCTIHAVRGAILRRYTAVCSVWSVIRAVCTQTQHRCAGLGRSERSLFPQ
ncbi:hypothetical protein NDU88_000391 [Pleurodeles waltl]|uniref:Secreted protein n=1 Tax=Pleurodeles waltl TaxID=8319 RepID=A0AAV7L8G5_PLEWA|nr:hypothetical protein NDU88_000391 [Pleurodeles waltl]